MNLTSTLSEIQQIEIVPRKRLYALDFQNEISVRRNLQDNAVIQTRRLGQFEGHLNAKSSPFQTAAEMARGIYESEAGKRGPLHLCVSGGLDSQAMLHAFVECGVPFQVAILKLHGGFNDPDFGGAMDLCDYYGLQPKIVDIDPIDFFESDQCRKIAERALTNSPLFSMHAHFAEKIDGVSIFAGEPWYHALSAERYLGFYIPDYKEYGTEIYMQHLGGLCLSHFFETSMAFLDQCLQHPAWKSRDVLEEDLLATYRAKYFAYRKAGFPMIVPAVFNKLHGFEKLYFYYQKKHSSRNFYHFNELFRKPLEQSRPIPEFREFECDSTVPNVIRESLRFDR
jgi:hypothetical protein